MEDLSLSSSSFAPSPTGVPLSLGDGNLRPLPCKPADEYAAQSAHSFIGGLKRARVPPNPEEMEKPPSSHVQGMFRHLESLQEQLETLGSKPRSRESASGTNLFREFTPLSNEEPIVKVKPHHILPIDQSEAVADYVAVKQPPAVAQRAAELQASAEASATTYVPSRNRSLSERRSVTTPPDVTASLRQRAGAVSPASALPNLGSLRPPQRPASPQKVVQAKMPVKAIGAGMPPSPTTRTRDGRIKVVVRKRPLMNGEPGGDCVAVSSPQVMLEVTKQRVDLSEYTQRSEYSFDDAFGPEDHNQAVYSSCAMELLDIALAGGSASCFAYGQTGSGKTHTMMGCREEKGLYLLAASDLFRRVTSAHRLEVSFYEIYCNSLFDLLNARSPVVLREGSDRRVNVCGLSWHHICSAEKLWDVISAGMDQRKTGSTSANEQSSRSHAVLSIRITQADVPEFQGIVNFVDLAGSERAADTANNDKQTRLEGAEINKSLLALKECIRALDERKKHVPFRGSRLTEVLRDSFTGNSKTVMIANISPSSLNFEHTSNTLRYAFRVKGLSVASVAPDKARNAPRPYVAPTRSRCRTEEHQPNATPPRESARPSGDARSVPKRHAHSASPSQERHPSGSYRNIVGKETSVGHRASSVEMSSLADGAEDVSGHTMEIRYKHLGPRGAHAPKSPGNSFTLGSFADAEDSRSILTEASREEMEERIRRSVVRKVQRDLGREIQHILDERDSLIAQLRKENAELRQKLEEARDGGSRVHTEVLPSLLSSVPFPEDHRSIAPTLKPSDAFIVRNSEERLTEHCDI